MSRIILFKAKRVDNNEWIEGCLVNNLWTYNEASDFPKGTNVCEIITGKYSGDCWEDISTDEDCIVSVHPETVCQFTGLLDKNGNKIFEGDIIGDWTIVDGINTQSKLQVFFDEMIGQWMLDTSFEQNKSISFSLFAELNDFDYTIISNIHD